MNFITKKIGPLPVWAWAVGVGVGVYVIRNHMGTQAAQVSGQPDSSVPPAARRYGSRKHGKRSKGA